MDLAFVKETQSSYECLSVIQHAKIAPGVQRVFIHTGNEPTHETLHAFFSIDENCCLSGCQAHHLVTFVVHFLVRAECLFKKLGLVLNTDLHRCLDHLHGLHQSTWKQATGTTFDESDQSFHFDSSLFWWGLRWWRRLWRHAVHHSRILMRAIKWLLGVGHTGCIGTRVLLLI